MPIQVSISNERHEQLKQFAHSQKTTIAGAIDLLVRDAVAAGKIPADLPGFKIERTGDSVVIDTGAWSRTLTRDLARTYAAQIRRATTPILTPGQDNPLIPDLAAVRRGAGVKLRDQKKGRERVVSPAIAQDVASLIEAAAKD